MEKFTGRENSTRLNFAGDSHDAEFGDHRFRARLARRAQPHNNRDFLDTKVRGCYEYLIVV